MEANQDMQVVWHAVDRKHSAALILYNAGDVFVDLFLMSRGNKGLPAFNGENELDDYLCIGVRHWAPSPRSISTKTYCSSGERGTSPFYKHTAPLGQGDRASGFYKHTAPLGQGIGRRASTNILPRWGRGNRGL